MGWIEDGINSIKSIEIRKLLNQAVTLGLLLALVLILWTTFTCVMGVKRPLSIVVSGSMEPAMKRGDMFLLYMSDDPIRVGEIIVFKFDGDDTHIVHRVIKVHENKDTGKVQIMTKGDNNIVDDIFLYPPGQFWLERHHIIGRVVGYMPYAGWPCMIIKENQKLAALGALGLVLIYFYGSKIGTYFSKILLFRVKSDPFPPHLYHYRKV